MSATVSMLMALGNPDPAVRVPAEQAVQQAKEADLAGFILTVLQEFRDDSNTGFARNMAGTLLKNAVAPSLREVAARQQLEQKWKQLPAEVRQRVKSEVLETLGSPVREVRNVAANIIGSLSRIELPVDEWPELIGMLINVARTGSEQHQEAALTTIGYICEEGQDHDEVEGPLHAHTEEMLGAIVQGLSSTNADVKFSATRALCTAMEYISANMENEQQRNYLIDALCTVQGDPNDGRVREMAMEALVKVADLYYSYLPAYISRLSEITTKAIFNDTEDVGLQAMLFWLAICETERDMAEEEDTDGSLNYAKNGMDYLVDICLRTLVMQDEMLAGDEEWNLSVAGGKLLQTLAEAVGQPIQAPIMNYVFAHINSENWREREAALMAFGCILGIDSEDAKLAIRDTVAQAVPGLINYLRDPDEHVADTAAWVTAVVCENYVDVFLRDATRLQELMNIVGPLLVNPEPRVARRACTILNNLALAYEDEDDMETNELSDYYSDLVRNLLLGIDSGSTVEYRTCSQETLNALVDAAAKNCLPYLNSLAPELLKRLSSSVEQLIAAGGVNEDLEGMVGLLCGAVAALARKLGGHYSSYLPQTMQVLLALINMTADYVQDEALTAVGALAYACKSEMGPYLSHIVPYILRCLQSFDEPDVQGIVVAAIGDLTLACSEQMKPYAADIMNVLYSSTIDPNVDRDIKVTLLSCFGDVIVNVLDAQSVLPYLGTLMPLMENMFNLSCAIDIRGDPDGEDYVMSLWESTATVYTSIVQTFRGDEVQALVPYLSGILRFALHAATHGNEFTETMVAALMVLGDMANVLREANPAIRQQAKSALLAPEVSQTFAQVQQHTGLTKDEKKSIKWVMTQLKKLEAS